jgi:hypothetical protein
MARQSTYKRIRGAVDKQKSKVILEYIRNHWDVVLNSSVTMMKGMPFFTRFRFALDIILGKRKGAMRAIREEKPKPGFKDLDNTGPKPGVTPPPQKPAKIPSARKNEGINNP